ncbi:MAG: S-layer homology domain-containing protein [Oscillospiraceae bacterium]|nr:S-layer homology domain-containing protein [Oscillospiraceae bacterium]
MKKFIAILLTTAMLISIVPPNAYVHTANADGSITRAEWIRELVALFDMTVEDDNMPDDYFTDITTDSIHYRDIMVATEFGVIDLEPGYSFNPDDPVTRDFAAQTMNFCLGFMPEDPEVVSDHTIIAVQRGWFALIGGSFMPERQITQQEKQTMLTDALIVLTSTIIDPNHENEFEFADEVIEIPQGTIVFVDENDTVTIYNNSQTLAAGDNFVVFVNDFPVAYTAQSVSVSGAVTTISTRELELDEIIKTANAEGIAEVDLSLTEPIGDAIITPVYSENQPQAFSALGINPTDTSLLEGINVKKKISLGDGGMSFEVDVKLSNLSYDYRFDTLNQEFYFILKGNSEFKSSVAVDLLKMYEIPTAIDLAQIRILGVGMVKVSLTYSLKGKLSLVYNCDFETGLHYTKDDGFRLVRNFRKQSFSLSAELECKVGLKISAGIDLLKIVSANIFVEIGGKLKCQIKTYTDNKSPFVCSHWSAHLYLDIGAEAKFFKLKWESKLEIFHEKNSPVRIARHFEDGKSVPSCIRNKSYFYGNGYSTPSNSRYIGAKLGGNREALPATINSSMTLTQNMSYHSDVYFTGGTIDLNGHTLTITGDFIQGSPNTGSTVAIMKINGGTLNIGGDYRIQSRTVDSSTSEVTYGDCKATLRMEDDSDYARVAGDFIAYSSRLNTYSSNNPRHYLLAGTMEFRGDFTLIETPNTYHVDTGFDPTGTHRVFFNGTGRQNVHFDEYSWAWFNNLEVSEKSVLSTSGTLKMKKLMSDVKIESDEVILSNAGGAGNFSLNGFDMEITGDVTISQRVFIDRGSTLKINGNLLSVSDYIGIGCLSETLDNDVEYTGGSTGVMLVNGNLTQIGGQIGLGGLRTGSGLYIGNGTGSLIVNGDYRSQNKETDAETGEVSYSYGWGLLTMCEVSSYMKVTGDFIMQSNIGNLNYHTGEYRGNLNAGKLEIGGDFIQLDPGFSGHDNFRATGTHTIILNGKGQQNIHFDNEWDSMFNNLIIANKTGPIIFETAATILGNLNQPGGAVIENRDNAIAWSDEHGNIGWGGFLEDHNELNADINRFVGNALNVIPTYLDCEMFTSGNPAPAKCEVCGILLEHCICEPPLYISSFNTTGNSWIEISNTSDDDISCKGLYLSNDSDDLYKWQMPSVIIRQESSVRVKSNDNNVDVVMKRMQANYNFKFGERMYLSDADGKILFEVDLV